MGLCTTARYPTCYVKDYLLYCTSQLTVDGSAKISRQQTASSHAIHADIHFQMLALPHLLLHKSLCLRHACTVACKHTLAGDSAPCDAYGC